MTIWLHSTKSIVPIREFLLIQIYNVNSITFPETEELQCSIFRCIPAPYPKSEWGPIPKCGGLDPTTLVGLLLRTLQTPILLRIESPNADTQACTQQSCSCSALRPPFFCSHAFLCGAFVTCDPPHSHSVFKWGQETHGSITDLTHLHPLEFLPLSFF